MNGAPVDVVVVGASGAIGAAFAELLAARADVRRVLALSRAGTAPAGAKIVTGTLDLLDETSIAAAAARAGAELDPPGLVVVATGLLHGADGLVPEKSWRQLDPDAMARVYRTNTVGPALVAKHFLPLLPRDRRAVFAALSARVGSIGDNQLGGWHSYRASKAALNMLLRNFAIELARRSPLAIVAGLHPGTVASALSAPFQSGVPAGQLFPPRRAAQQMLHTLDHLTPADSGAVFAYDGQRLPD